MLQRLFSLAALLALVSCGSSVSAPNVEGGKIETVLSSDIVDRGAVVDVTCLVYDEDGDEVGVATVVSVDPMEGITLDDHALTTDALGDFMVACATANGMLMDDTPARLIVSTGGIREVETAFKETTIQAGDTIDVPCALYGADQQAIEGETFVSATPDDGVTIDDHALTFTVVGDFEVACSSFEAGMDDETPVLVHVIPGDPNSTEALPSTDSAQAGDAVVVGCKVFDAYGNEITDFETVVDEQDGLVVTGHTVVGEIAGEYEITCSVDGWDDEVTQIPGLLVVEAAEPAAVELKPSPKKSHYDIDTQVTLKVIVTDIYGNELEDVDYELGIPEVQGLYQVNDHKVKLKREGIYDLFVELAAPYSDIRDDLSLICDETGPAIDLLFPDRGQTFTGDPSVMVQGVVTDPISGIDWVKINDQEVEVEPDGYFEFLVPCKHGANPLMVEARDGFSHKSFTTRGWYYSTAYQPADTPMEEARIQDGAMVYMGQDVLDDGDHDPNHIDDMATIFEVILGGLDVQQILDLLPPLVVPLDNIINLTLPIPGITVGIVGGLDIEVVITEITMGSPSVQLTTRDGGMDMVAGFAPVEFGLSFIITLHIEAVASVGNLIDEHIDIIDPAVTTVSSMGAAVLALTTSFDVEKLPEQDITVASKDFHLELQGVDIDPLEELYIDLGELDLGILGTYDLNPNGPWDLSQFVGNINDLISNNVLNPLINLIIPVLSMVIEPIVELVIGPAIELIVGLLVLDLPLEIPPLLPGQTDPIALRISTELSTVIFSDDGGRIGLGLGLQSEKGVDRDPLGSILRDGCAGGDPDPVLFTFDPQPEMQIGARYDFVNQALFAVWWTGLLNLDIPLDQLGDIGGGGLPIDISNLNVRTEFLLPPILNDCGSKGLQEIQVADLYLHLTFKLAGKTHEVGAWLQLRATGGIMAAGTEIGIGIEKIATFDAEIMDITGELGAFMPLIESFLPMVVNMVEGQSFMFPIPPIDLSIIPGVPAGSSIQLGDLSAYNKKGVTIFGGDLL